MEKIKGKLINLKIAFKKNQETTEQGVGRGSLVVKCVPSIHEAWVQHPKTTKKTSNNYNK
jgi:hypothetical protein